MHYFVMLQTTKLKQQKSENKEKQRSVGLIPGQEILNKY